MTAPSAALTPRRAGGRNLLALSFLALVALLFAAGGGAFWVIGHPSRPACTLPALDLPAPADLLAWSPDSRELLVASFAGIVQLARVSPERWRLFRVRFAQRSVTELRPLQIGGGITRVLWQDHHPLVCAVTLLPELGRRRQELFCLEGWGPGWQKREVPREQFLISPDFHRAAALHLTFGAHPGGTSTAGWMPGTRYSNPVLSARLEVLRLPSLAVERDFPLRPLNSVGLDWRGASVLHLLASPAQSSGDFEWRGGESSLRLVEHLGPAGLAGKRPRLTAGVSKRPLKGHEVRTWLAQHGISSAPEPPLEDYLVVRDSNGRELRAEPLGAEMHRPQRAPVGTPPPAVSPDGQNVVVRAADDTLRLLELR